MTRFFFWLIVAAMVGALVYAYIDQAGLPIPGTAIGGSINAKIDQALLSASVDVTEFGGTTVTLENGEAGFSTGEGSGGFVMLGKPRGIVVKGEDADVFALLNVNGGGTGTFAYLAHYEFNGATGEVAEIEKVLLGDRIAVDDIKTEITAPTEYQVLVSLRDRLQGEAMAAEPTEPRVFHFKRGADGLELAALTFGTLQDHDVILFGPLPDQQIDSTFTVSGAARGPWYFEANLPIRLKTYGGEELAAVGAQAQGEWMTTELVPFTATMVAPNTAHGAHILVIAKDNPSGLPEHDKSYEVPVILK